MSTRPRSPWLPVGAALTAAALTLSGCAGGFDATATEEESTSIVAALPTDPTSMDPIKTGSLVVLSVFFNTFDQLTKITADGELKPKFATSWEANEDLTEWDFTLAEGVTASNGEEMTADDVVYSYEQILADDTSENYGYLTSVKKVTKVDDHTVRFIMHKPFSAFPANTSLISIVPSDTYAELGPEKFAREPVGSGPYVFTKITKGVSYDLARNDSYWGKAPAVDQISLQPVASDESRVNGVRSNTLDVAQIGPSQVKPLEGSDAVAVSSALSNGVVFLGVNSTEGVLADPKVRRALALAIDKEAIPANLLSGLAEPATTMLAPSVTGFPDSVEGTDYDPEEAGRLLDETGYDGEPIVFEYATDGRIPMSSEVAQAIQGYLGDAGFTVKMVGTDQESHTLKVRNKEMQGIYLNTWAPSTVDGDLPMTDFYEEPGNNNYAQDPKTADYAVAQRAVTGEDREQVFADLLDYSNQQGYFIPLYVPMNNFAANPDLDWAPRADGLYDFSETSYK